MKTELKAKYLQNLLKKKKNQNAGFTLIELLVVIIIIGVLAAIALPSMLNQAAKARESSAKSQVGAINRAQQAYRLENSTFAGSTTDLKLSTLEKPDGYNAIEVEATAGTSATASATGLSDDVKDFCGTVTAASGTTSATLVEKTDGC